MIQNKVALMTEEYVRKALRESIDDEIALDALAQWASNPVGKKAGYGVQENYPIILLNLTRRFDISSVIATEYVSKLREYGTQFLLSGGDINAIRELVLNELNGDVGKKWRQGMAKRLAKAPVEIKRLAYLLFFLMHHGFEAKIFADSLDKIQAFYSVVFEKPFPYVERQDDLIDFGIVNRFLYTSEDLSRNQTDVTSPIFSSDSLGLNRDDLKIQSDAKQIVSHMVDKKMFDQLHILEEISRENFGIKRFEEEVENFRPEKRITGKYKSYMVISPFLLEEIRDDIRSLKQHRLLDYESRIESTLKLVSESWPDGKFDYVRLEGEQVLWRVDNGTNTKLFVYLAVWTNDTDLCFLLSKLDVPKASGLVAIVLNQSPESVRASLNERLGDCGELTLICPINQKESQTETLVGSTTRYSAKFVQILSKSLNLSVPLAGLSKKDSAPAEISLGAQFGKKSERPKVLLGSQGGREIYWTEPLERNSNVGIFGDAGSGKTQTIKRILVGLRKSGITFLVLDSSGEYLPKDGSSMEFGTGIGLSEITVNPLELEKGNSPRDQKYCVLESLDGGFGFSEEEKHCLRNAIKSSYERKGIFEDNKSTWIKTPPTLQDLRVRLEHLTQEGNGRWKNAAKEILGKIGPVLGHSLFSQARTRIPFQKLVTGPIIVNLSELQDPTLKAITVEFIAGKIPYFAENSSGALQLCIIIDGLQKLMARNSSTLRLLREARRRAIGIIYSSQNPANLSELVFTNTAAILSFRMTESKNAKVLGEYMGVRDSNLLNKGLENKFSAMSKFSSDPSAIKFDVLPYFQHG